MDLKTESINHIKQVGQVLLSGEYEVNLSEGETLVARVEQKQGDSVVLRNNRNGTLINASIGSEADIESGDQLEMSVSKNSAGYLLYILDIVHSGQDTSRQYTRDSLSDVLAALKTNSGLGPKAAAFLAENNVQITPDNIEELKNIINRGQGITQLLSELLSETFKQQAKTEDSVPQDWVSLLASQETGLYYDNSSANTENGRAVNVSPPTGGDLVLEQEAASAATQYKPDTANVLGESLLPDNNGVINTGGYSRNAVTETQGNTDPVIQTSMDNMNANVTAANSGIDIPKSRTPDIKEYVPAEVNDTVQVNARKDNGSVQTPEVIRTYSGSEQASVQTDKTAYYETLLRATPNDKSSNVITEKAAAKIIALAEQNGLKYEINDEISGAQESATKSTESLSRLIKKEINQLFIRPHEQTGEQIKKTIIEMPGKLNMLKLLVSRTDTKDKDIYMDKMDQAQKQLKLGSEFNRFYYIELPFMTQNGEQKQAELYIQKNAGRRQKEDPSENVVLISLNTQNLGLIETLIKAKKENISIEFRLEREEYKQEFNQSETKLAEAMKEAGYTLNSLSVTGLEKRTTLMNADKLFAEDAVPRAGKIDVQI